MISAVALLCAALALQDEERLRVDDENEAFLRHWATALEEKDAQRLRILMEEAHDKKSAQLFRPDPKDPLWLPLPRALAPRLAALPDGIREPWENIAQERLDREFDPVRRRALAEAWAGTRAGRDALAQIGNDDFDRNDLLGAIRAWTRLLEIAPSAGLAVRLARAHALRDDARAVASLLARSKAEGWTGDVSMGARRVPLAEALAAVRREPPPVPAPRGLVPTAELSLGRLELKADGSAYGAKQHAAMIPAWTEVDGRGLLIFSNGIRVLAVDPSRADGGPLDASVAWRHPKEGFIRYVLPWTHTQGFSRPPAGATVANGRVYANVFTPQAREPVRLRRGNQDSFEGPSALRAIDARTGDLIWDTDAMETYDPDGEPIKRVAQLFDRRYVCFCGPPLVRGDFLYVPVMSSPRSGRECWVACFRASDGEPLWKTWIAAFATSQDVLSITAVSEQDGMIAVASNFGVVAALDSRTGRVEWLRSYLEEADRPGGRPLPSAPVIAGSVVYVLAQDATLPLAFDRWTGRALPWPELDVPWEDVDALVGRSGDWLVFAGKRNRAVRPSDGRVVNLGDEESPAAGRAALSGGRLYLPSRAGLRVFDATTWALLDTHAWAAGTQGGNVAVHAGMVAVLGDKLDLCTSEGLLAGEEAETLLRRARAFENGGRAKEAIDTFQRGLKLLEKDSARADEIRARIEKLREAPAEEKK
jgi:outer membrane protein assembly factor BamB